MAKFKKGDKVVRVERFRDSNWCDAVPRPSWMFVVKECDNSNLKLEDVNYLWSPAYFDLYVEPQPEPVTVTEPAVQQIPGVPDGYRLVRIGAPKKGEQYLDMNGGISVVDCDWWKMNIPLIEPIVPPAPPIPIPTTVKVQLNRYLVGDLQVPATLFVLEATEEYIENNYVNYRLLGPSETLELEVEV